MSRYLDADFIENNIDKFKADLVGYEPKLDQQDYLAEFK